MELKIQLLIDYKTFISTETTTFIEFYKLTCYVSVESLLSLTNINAYFIHLSITVHLLTVCIYRIHYALQKMYIKSKCMLCLCQIQYLLASYGRRRQVAFVPSDPFEA